MSLRGSHWWPSQRDVASPAVALRLTIPRVIQAIAASAALGLLAGCGNPAEQSVKSLFRPSPDTDVTTSNRYNFASFAGTVWKTKAKTAVADTKRYTGAQELMLLVPKHFDQSDPDYTSGTSKQIIAVLSTGARVRIEKLTQDRGAWGGVMVRGTVEDGTNSWKNVYLDDMLFAKNRFIWTGSSSSTNWGVDPDMLEKP